MISYTYEEFKNGLTELFNNAVNGGHPDYCNMRCYEDLPHNIASQHYGKNFHDKWWFLFDFNEIYTGIITYEPWIDNFTMYLEDRGVSYNGQPPVGRTMKISLACSIGVAWSLLGTYINMIYNGWYYMDRNDVWYSELTANTNYLNGDSPFDCPCSDMSFTRALQLIEDARKHPDKEWRGQVLGLSLGGQFAPCDFVTKIR